MCPPRAPARVSPHPQVLRAVRRVSLTILYTYLIHVKKATRGSGGPIEKKVLDMYCKGRMTLSANCKFLHVQHNIDKNGRRARGDMPEFQERGAPLARQGPWPPLAHLVPIWAWPTLADLTQSRFSS